MTFSYHDIAYDENELSDLEDARNDFGFADVDEALDYLRSSKTKYGDRLPRSDDPGFFMNADSRMNTIDDAFTAAAAINYENDEEDDADNRDPANMTMARKAAEYVEVEALTAYRALNRKGLA